MFWNKTKLYKRNTEITPNVCTVFYSELLETYLYLLFHLKQRDRHSFRTVKEGSHFRKLEDSKIMAHLRNVNQFQESVLWDHSSMSGAKDRFEQRDQRQRDYRCSFVSFFHTKITFLLLVFPKFPYLTNPTPRDILQWWPLVSSPRLGVPLGHVFLTLPPLYGSIYLFSHSKNLQHKWFYNTFFTSKDGIQFWKADERYKQLKKTELDRE